MATCHLLAEINVLDTQIEALLRAIAPRGLAFLQSSEPDCFSWSGEIRVGPAGSPLLRDYRSVGRLLTLGDTAQGTSSRALTWVGRTTARWRW